MHTTNHNHDHSAGEREAPTATSATFSSAGGNEGGEGGAPAAAAPSSPPSPAPVANDGAQTPLTASGDDVYRPAPATNPVVAALQKAGLYGSFAGGNQHSITCPWASEHVGGEKGSATYFSPTEEVPHGAFYCPCSHKEPRKIGSLLRHLQVEHKEARCKPTIRVIQGEIHRVVQRAAEVLAHRGGFYQASGGDVTLRFDPATGDVTTEPVNEQTLTMHLSAACDWQKFDMRSEEWRRCDVPPPVVKALANTASIGALKPLAGLARQPYLRRTDGGLVTTPGYDAESGMFSSFDAAQFTLPEPTRENALAGLNRLKSLLDEFEFAADTDRSTTLSAMLTATIRDSLRIAPGFNITASSPGSGKSYLASVLAAFTGPADARNMSYPFTQEEATKVVLSLALEQPAAVCFDDMPTDWLPHGAMNRMMTSGSITERKLGTNTVMTARASSFIMGTGNNIRPIRDMARRVASIYILPQVETAATRSFTGNPLAEVRRNRARYVSDALTIIAAWRAAGSPQGDVPNVAGFEDWSNLCRHSLIWLGEPDPATSLIAQIAYDPDQEQLGNLLYAWRARSVNEQR